MAEAALVYLPQYYTGTRAWVLKDNAGDPVDLTGHQVELRVRRAGTADLSPTFSRVLSLDQGFPGRVTYTFTMADWSQRTDDVAERLSPEVGALYDLWFIDYFLPMNINTIYPEDRPGVLEITTRAGLPT